MAVVEEFVFKIPKAKDLPPSWYELVLRPTKFQEHLQRLEKTPLVEPSPLVLIATFLEKAGCIEGQTIPEGYQISEDRRQVLVDCAHFMAAFLHWDLTVLEKGLPVAVVYSLLTSLTKTFPLYAPLSQSSLTTVTAHTLYSDWVVRSLTEIGLARKTPQGLLWEGTCLPSENINELLQPELERALSILAEVCKLEQNEFQLPCTSLQLPPSFGQTEPAIVTLPHSVTAFSRDKLCLQLSFDMGQILFKQEKHAMAKESFALCEELLSCGGWESKTTMAQQALPISASQLKGYLSACSCLLGDPVTPTHDSVLAVMEKTRENTTKTNGLLDLLGDNAYFRNFSDSYKTYLEIECCDWSDSVASCGNKQAKRSKLKPARLVPLSTYVTLWNGVSGVAGGTDVSPRVWGLLSQGGRAVLVTLFSLVSMALEGVESDSASWRRLAAFVRSVCMAHPQWSEIRSPPILSRLLSEAPPLSSTSLASRGSIPKSGGFLCQILSSPTPTKLLDLVSSLLKATPVSEHAGLASKCQGNKPYFATSDLIPKLQPQIQYNLLLHRAESLALNEEFSAAIEFSAAALTILLTRGAVPAATVPKLRPVLDEYILKVGILGAGAEMKQEMPKNAQEVHGCNIRDVKHYYTGNQVSDPNTMALAAVFLLNMQQYEFLAQHEPPSLPDRVCQRLAVAALCSRDSRETRKCTRDLFETISAIFSGGNVSQEKKLQRKCLEVISAHLQDTCCLSYLMATLTRLWNMIQKPDFEVSSELPKHWPTAIGNAGSISADHVLRVLESMLKRALQVHPMRTAWVVMEAELLTATGSYGAALQGYVKAGIQDSNFFEVEVSESVWNQQVYHKMIYCCSNLGYHTQAVIFCQFLNPPDYQFTFSLLRDSISDILESMFEYLWDMTLIEFLIYTLAKQGDGIKQAAAVQVASQPELNTHNHGEILSRAVHVRRRKFLRTFSTMS